jgi:hypothetical protein
MMKGYTREDLEAVADKLLGIPYKPGAIGELGCNCTGLVCMFYQRLGISLPFAISHYPAEVLAHDFSSYFDRVDSPKDGDVARMDAKEGEPRHIGIVIGSNILHVHHRRGVVRTAAHHLPVIEWYRLNDKAERV